jgi:sterol desaturase/sphingolipid hydroxylase (fatty acid hydroxylase superfamily)
MSVNASLIYVTAILIIILSEFLIPLREKINKPLKHYFHNFLIAIPTVLTVRLAVLPVLYFISKMTMEKEIGLTYLLGLSPLSTGIVSFLFNDYGFYWWHVINHRWKFLWRFHLVHHIDTDLDFSTNLRFHFVEVLFSIIWRGSVIFLIGIPFEIILIYETIFQVSTLFHHGNIKLNIHFESLLTYIIATPRMHGIHHSVDGIERDSNYAVILTLWDRIHRTLNLNRFKEKIMIGVTGHDLRSFKETQLLPFKKDIV